MLVLGLCTLPLYAQTLTVSLLGTLQEIEYPKKNKKITADMSHRKQRDLVLQTSSSLSPFKPL